MLRGIAKAGAIGTGAALALALGGAGAASAHTSATCVLNAAQISCVGTVSDHSISPSGTDAELSISAGQGHISFDVNPLMMIFSSTIPVDGQLVCAPQLGGAGCAGRGEAGTDQILIFTSGAADGSSAVVTLRDAPPANTADPTVTAEPSQHRRSHKHHHHRHHRRTGG
jgi:hypothetical protein